MSFKRNNHLCVDWWCVLFRVPRNLILSRRLFVYLRCNVLVLCPSREKGRKKKCVSNRSLTSSVDDGGDGGGGEGDGDGEPFLCALCYPFQFFRILRSCAVLVTEKTEGRSACLSRRWRSSFVALVSCARDRGAHNCASERKIACNAVPTDHR